ncbi:fumarylacetoacetate hydrolase family protein [Modestobacter sp. I12A-02628]|uniref:Fumarylacetoacetate hydrolase family protein n=1 Tax=Goekera deserti TaxID=2497753 RepID=A0A7K3WG50_9ACTN|nr:fumarylacetoacetate hydrolase family protein [Goekera deserti]MPQ96781.1 fumarylacetoacetate hydrolase family protein [Goekera deserti]NDI46905.1 fumarylacetoacetate hydrolase family protein [Goekera deserti]NEL54473.1 fumarylacetoacetate hydrolase family protein [Goekera deserti]
MTAVTPATRTPEHPVDEATGLRRDSFALASYAEGDRRFPALVGSDGTVTDLSGTFPDLHAVFDDWTRNLQVVGDLWASGSRPTRPLAGLRPLPPLSHPNLLAAGANYKTHSAQMLTKNEFNQHNRRPGESDEDFFARNLELMETRSREGVPFFWTGLHSSLVGAQDDVVLPVLGNEPDWELELGVVLGGTGRLLTPDEALEKIAGYTIVNDLGTVDLFRRTDIPWGYDWVSKHQPTFKPAGPFVVPAQFFTLDDTIRTTLSVNGQVMQDWPTADLIFRPEQFVAYASERVRLTPGDMIVMGSPPGNGKHHGRFLADGDVIDSTITYLGSQRNRCVAEDAHGRTPHFGDFPAS